MAGAIIDSLEIGCDPAPWRELGFVVAGDGSCAIGHTTLQLRADGEQSGIRGWTLRNARGEGPLDGLPTVRLPGPVPPRPEPAEQHPNTARSIDHVVVRTPDFERTLEAVDAAGMRLRMTREAPGGMRQAFFRHGEAILEVVGPPEPQGDEPAQFWGLVASVQDIDLAAQIAGPGLGEIKSAVQRGRRIATVRESAGLSMRVALISQP